MLLPKYTHAQTPLISAAAGIPAECAVTDWASLDDIVASAEPGQTLYVRISGQSMQDDGIDHGDVLIVHLTPVAVSGKAVLARLGDGYTVKHFHELDPVEKRRRLYLVPANAEYRVRAIHEHDEFEIVGTVEYVLKRYRR